MTKPTIQTSVQHLTLKINPGEVLTIFVIDVGQIEIRNNQGGIEVFTNETVKVRPFDEWKPLNRN